MKIVVEQPQPSPASGEGFGAAGITRCHEDAQVAAGGMLDGQHIALGVVIERSYDAQPGVTGREVSIRAGETLVLRTAECRGRDRLLELIERIVDRVAPNL